jgi:glycosyltransferase involved in cell wall biosynthesis
MKILLVGRCVTSLPPRSGGGAEWHGYHLAKELDKLGHEVHYVTNYATDCKETLEFNGLKVYNTYRKISPKEISRFPFMSFNKWILKHFKENMLAARTARSVLAQEKDFDVIHCHGNLAALILSKERVPVVFTEHDASPWMCTYRSFYERFIRKSSYYLLNKKAMERVSHVITVSSAQRKFLIENWQFNLKKITTIPNGVDTVAFKPDNNGKDILKKHSLPEDYSIFVGRLEPRKGIDYLIRSMKGFNMASVIVGSGPDRSRLEELAKKSGVSSRITFTGGVSNEDLRHLYSNAKFFVLPSISEGMPLTVLEAMASGIPVVANNINGIPDIVQDGYNGLLAEPRDIDSFMNAQQILLKDAMLRKKMGQRARETVEKNYSWKTVAHRVVDVYERVLL